MPSNAQLPSESTPAVPLPGPVVLARADERLALMAGEFMDDQFAGAAAVREILLSSEAAPRVSEPVMRDGGRAWEFKVAVDDAETWISAVRLSALRAGVSAALYERENWCARHAPAVHAARLKLVLPKGTVSDEHLAALMEGESRRAAHEALRCQVDADEAYARGKDVTSKGAIDAKVRLLEERSADAGRTAAIIREDWPRACATVALLRDLLASFRSLEAPTASARDVASMMREFRPGSEASAAALKACNSSEERLAAETRSRLAGLFGKTILVAAEPITSRGSRPAASPAHAPDAAPRAGRSRRTPWAVGAAVSLVLAAGGAYAAFGRSERPVTEDEAALVASLRPKFLAAASAAVRRLDSEAWTKDLSGEAACAYVLSGMSELRRAGALSDPSLAPLCVFEIAWNGERSALLATVRGSPAAWEIPVDPISSCRKMRPPMTDASVRSVAADCLAASCVIAHQMASRKAEDPSAVALSAKMDFLDRFRLAENALASWDFADGKVIFQPKNGPRCEIPYPLDPVETASRLADLLPQIVESAAAKLPDDDSGRWIPALWSTVDKAMLDVASKRGWAYAGISKECQRQGAHGSAKISLIVEFLGSKLRVKVPAVMPPLAAITASLSGGILLPGLVAEDGGVPEHVTKLVRSLGGEIVSVVPDRVGGWTAEYRVPAASSRVLTTSLKLADGTADTATPSNFPRWSQSREFHAAVIRELARAAPASARKGDVRAAMDHFAKGYAAAAARLAAEKRFPASAACRKARVAQAPCDGSFARHALTIEAVDANGYSVPFALDLGTMDERDPVDAPFAREYVKIPKRPDFSAALMRDALGLMDRAKKLNVPPAARYRWLRSEAESAILGKPNPSLEGLSPDRLFQFVLRSTEDQLYFVLTPRFGGESIVTSVALGISDVRGRSEFIRGRVGACLERVPGRLARGWPVDEAVRFEAYFVGGALSGFNILGDSVEFSLPDGTKAAFPLPSATAR